MAMFTVWKFQDFPVPGCSRFDACSVWTWKEQLLLCRGSRLSITGRCHCCPLTSLLCRQPTRVVTPLLPYFPRILFTLKCFESMLLVHTDLESQHSFIGFILLPCLLSFALSSSWLFKLSFCCHFLCTFLCVCVLSLLVFTHWKQGSGEQHDFLSWVCPAFARGNYVIYM